MNSKTILIIEDNFSHLKMARELLQMAGFVTLEAMNAEDGLRLAREYRPDLILMDLYLEETDGYASAEALKADSRTRNIPIIAFTASTVETERQKTLDSGFNGFIGKPINVRDFAQTVTVYLQASGLNRVSC